MANANISAIQVTNTFDEWRVATNDLIQDRNILRNKTYVKDESDLQLANGALTLSRSTGGVLLTITGSGGALVGGTTTTSDLTVQDDASVANNLTVSGNVIASGNVSISKNTVISGELSVTSNVTVNTDKFTVLASNGLTTINGVLSVSNTVSDNTKILGGNDVILFSSSSNNINLGFGTSNIRIGDTSGTVFARGKLNVAGELNVSSALNVTGVATLKSNANVDGSLLVLADANVSGNIFVNGKTTLNGNSWIRNRLDGDNAFFDYLTVNNAIIAPTPVAVVTIEYFVVAGGGSGGGGFVESLSGAPAFSVSYGGAGGGGGAGGVVKGIKTVTTNTVLTVTVGAGASNAAAIPNFPPYTAGPTPNPSYYWEIQAVNGANSEFDGEIAVGGGAGATAASFVGAHAANTGGSGGGGRMVAYQSVSPASPSYPAVPAQYNMMIAGALGYGGQGFGGGAGVTNDYTGTSPGGLFADASKMQSGGGGGGAGGEGNSWRKDIAPLGPSNEFAGALVNRNTLYGRGGEGIYNNFTGSLIAYGGGGGGGKNGSPGRQNPGSPGPFYENIPGGTGGGGGGGRYANNYIQGNGLPGETNKGGGGGGAADVSQIRFYSTTSPYAETPWVPGASGAFWTTGGSGGSGVVILRYLSYYANAVTTGSPTYNLVGNYRVYTFTGSGTIKIPTL